MAKDEAMKLALDTLETELDLYRENSEDGAPDYILDTITALREALAEQPTPVQGWKLVPVEPTQKMLDAPPNAYPADALVTWKAMLAAAPQSAQRKPLKRCMEHGECFGGECIYTSPPAQRTWVGLTDDDLETAMEGAIDKWDIAEIIEAKLKEKNT